MVSMPHWVQRASCSVGTAWWPERQLWTHGRTKRQLWMGGWMGGCVDGCVMMTMMMVIMSTKQGVAARGGGGKRTKCSH